MGAWITASREKSAHSRNSTTKQGNELNTHNKNYKLEELYAIAIEQRINMFIELLTKAVKSDFHFISQGELPKVDNKKNFTSIKATTS